VNIARVDRSAFHGWSELVEQLSIADEDIAGTGTTLRQRGRAARASQARAARL
jgi:hypothetical protein